MKQRISTFATFLFSACFITVPPARADDIKIALTKVPVEPREFTRHDACIPLPLTSIEKMPHYKFPEPVCSNPPVFYLDYRGRKHVFMKDIDKPGTMVYNRLYYDSDHDHDLSDEDPTTLDLRVIGRGYYQQFSTVNLDLDVFGHKTWRFQTMEGSFALDDAKYGDRPARLVLQYRDALSGGFAVDEANYRIDFFDVLADGIISDATSTNRYRTSDVMRIVRNTDDPERKIRIPCGKLPKLLVIDNHSFHLNPDPDGKSCTLREIAQEGSGSVKFPDDLLYTQLESVHGGVLVSQPEGEIRLPPGKYTAQKIYLMRRGKDGRPWIISERNHKGTSVTVAADATSKIDIGDPFTLTCSMRKSRREGYNSYPCIAFSDKNGRAMSTDITVSGWPKAPCPTYKLVSSAGDEVKHGRMGYG